MDDIIMLVTGINHQMFELLFFLIYLVFNELRTNSENVLAQEVFQ